MTILWVPKTRDVVKAMYTAYGLAYFIEQVFSPETVSITIQDMGYAYQIQLDRESEIIIDTVRKNGLPLLLPAIFNHSKKDIDEAGDIEQIQRKYIPLGYPNHLLVDYHVLREQHHNVNKNEPSDDKVADNHTDNHTLNYPLYDLLCVGFLRGSVMRVLYPLLVHIWYAHNKDLAHAVNLVNLVLQFFANPNVDTQEFATAWITEIKAQLSYPDFQLFNWRQGQADVTLSSLLAATSTKGQNLNKANQRKQETTLKVFWLEVFFAFVGFMTVAMPFPIKGNGHRPDLVIFYPMFEKTDWLLLRQTVSLCKQNGKKNKRFHNSSSYSRQKLSVLVFLDWYQAMITLKGQFITNNQTMSLATANYKFLSSNHSPDGSAVFKLFSVPSLHSQDSERSLIRLRRLQAELSSIDDRDSENFTIFRDLLSCFETEDFRAWIRFTLYLTEHRLKTISSAPWPPPNIEFFEELTQMSSKHRDYRPVIQDPGLKDLANAINFCAIRIAYRKHGKKKISTAFRIRYGLGFELLRASNDSEIFLRVVSNFIHEYTNESLSVFLATRETRPRIPVSAYEAIVNLVSLYGSDLVAHVLVGLAFSNHFQTPELDKSSSKQEGEKS